MDDPIWSKELPEIIESGKSAEQQPTVKLTKKANTRKRKITQPLKNHPDSNIRHDKEVENDIKELKKNQRVILDNQKLILDKLEKLTNRIDNMTSSSSYPCLKKPTLPGSSVDECIHGEVLQENMKMLVQDMDLSDGFILDEMLQNGSLTDGEAQEIIEINRRDKSRKLAIILARKNKSKFRNFLKLIEEEQFYPHIAKVLRQSYEEKLEAQDKHPKCVRCFIIKNVNIKHIVDHLCENQLLDLDEINYLIKGDRAGVDQFWRTIFEKMAHPIFGKSCVSVFAESLRKNYPHISKRIGGQHHLKCLCTSTILSYPSGSGGTVSERSTTTTINPGSKIQEHLNSNQSNGSIADSSDISSFSVIPEPKPETLKWVQKHHCLPDEIVEVESIEDLENENDEPNMSLFLSIVNELAMIEKMCNKKSSEHSKQTIKNRTKIIVKNDQKKINQDNKSPIHIRQNMQFCDVIDSEVDNIESPRMAYNPDKKVNKAFKMPGKMPRRKALKII